MNTDRQLSAPTVTDTIESAREAIAIARGRGNAVGLVPTMGFFHQGHLSLMRAARDECDFVAVSIFLNPIQFAAGEDLESYPRDEARDLALAAGEGVDLIFTPSGPAMYPDGHATRIQPGPAASGLCGRSRPNHFQGVLTVVSKLFNIFEPDLAYFGQKDAQQAAVIRSMVDDLNIPVGIRLLPTIRESDGLAMSSRNAYLSDEDRSQATVLYEALLAARAAVKAGEDSADGIRQLIWDTIAGKPRIEIEYVEVVEARTMMPLDSVSEDALAVLAVRAGKARLIDNIYLKGQEQRCAG